MEKLTVYALPDCLTALVTQWFDTPECAEAMLEYGAVDTGVIEAEITLRNPATNNDVVIACGNTPHLNLSMPDVRENIYGPIAQLVAERKELREVLQAMGYDGYFDSSPFEGSEPEQMVPFYRDQINIINGGE